MAMGVITKTLLVTVSVCMLLGVFLGAGIAGALSLIILMLVFLIISTYEYFKEKDSQ